MPGRPRLPVRRSERREAGFTTVTMAGIMLAATLFSVAAIAVADGDISDAREDVDRKQAYAAAEAGLNDYIHHLDRDNSYWSKCTDVPPPDPSRPQERAPVNQAWSGQGSDPRVWRNVPGSEARYTIELLPAPGSSECVAGQDTSMIDPATGTFRIRATGRSRGITRSIVATFRRRGFLDYIYFTDFEALDPAYDGTTAECAQYERDGRSQSCVDIQFVNADRVNGPLHTNDELLICGRPTFGRTPEDPIEIERPDPGSWRGSGSTGCAPNEPNFVGNHVPGALHLAVPPSNTSLSTVAEPAYRFSGRTEIVLAGDTMTVNGTTMPFPPNGVIYISNATGCSPSYTEPVVTYPNASPCADVYLRGTYSKGLTIASAKDIIVNGNVERAAGSDALLGLIPNNFVRIFHPVTGTGCTSATSASNASNAPMNVRIDAAMLTLQHSFIVDNFRCGAPLGTLTVNGAIGQRFRGAVGTGGAQSSTGFIKNYNYDDRLRYRAPPYFLDPVQAGWRTVRVNEQIPAR